mmetsp:Transcript_5457/g.20399  ORF Transcript_5457/g.20399 Transcript_5457/m.20399 type:complete len:177 (+) Transcript_5457:258-788(+)
MLSCETVLRENHMRNEYFECFMARSEGSVLVTPGQIAVIRERLLIPYTSRISHNNLHSSPPRLPYLQFVMGSASSLNRALVVKHKEITHRVHEVERQRKAREVCLEKRQTNVLQFQSSLLLDLHDKKLVEREHSQRLRLQKEIDDYEVALDLVLNNSMFPSPQRSREVCYQQTAVC